VLRLNFLKHFIAIVCCHELLSPYEVPHDDSSTNVFLPRRLPLH